MSAPSYGTPPVIPPQFHQYNSYVTDPIWQRRFTAIWASILGFIILLRIPRVIREATRGRGVYESRNWFGVTEDLKVEYSTLTNPPTATTRTDQTRNLGRKAESVVRRFESIFFWTAPIIGVNVGHALLLVAYLAAFLVCVIKDAPLVDNANRAGFLALAQLPVIFLFATKNTVLSFLLGPGNGYEKLNFIHRWSGRIMFLGVVIHGSLWIRNDLRFNLPILGEAKEESGIRAFAILGVLVILSIQPFRKWFYETFLILHFVLFIAFFISICYHTTFAIPWIFPPIALYGLDILLRLCKYRIKNAILVPVDSQMTLVHIPYATNGWIAGQHLRVRLFFSWRMVESHPMTIFCAPPDVTCITSLPQGLSLGVRAVGDWSTALNFYTNNALHQDQDSWPFEFHNTGRNSHDEACSTIEMKILDPLVQHAKAVPVLAMIDGPYGGSSVDIGEFETALLVAGGSGITFTLGLLDDIVGRCVRKGRVGGERTRRIEFVWCLRSYEQMAWVSSALCDVANVAKSSSTLVINMLIYLTTITNTARATNIPNCEVIASGSRPSIYCLLLDLAEVAQRRNSVHSETTSYEESHSHTHFVVGNSSGVALDNERSEGAPFGSMPVSQGGGIAVCASGPQSLTSDAANAVAKFSLMAGGRNTAIALHTETFAL